QAVFQDKAGNVLEAHRLDPLVLHDRDRLQPPRWHVYDHLSPRAGSRNQGRLDRPGHQRNRAMTAGGAVARVVEEHHAELGAVILRLRDKAAVHVGVPARLEDESLANVVEMLQREAPLPEDGLSLEARHATADNAERLAGGVI